MNKYENHMDTFNKLNMKGLGNFRGKNNSFTIGTS